MSKRLDVQRALAALVAAALPYATVLGLDDETAPPTRVGPGGQAVLRPGDPGDPEVDLSPLNYNYTHPIPIEILAHNEASLDAMLIAIGGAVEGDRFLGGLCDWLEPIAPQTESVAAENSVGLRGAELVVVASYATPNPLN